MTIQLGNTATTSALSRYRGEATWALLLLPLLGARRIRRTGIRLGPAGLLLCLLISGSLLGLSGCGTAGVFTQTPRSYTVSVTATSGTMQHTTTFTLNVR